MTVLLTGFPPFLEFDENPSSLVTGRLAGKTVGGHPVVATTVPVDYAGVEKALLEEIDAVDPSLVLGFGLAAGRDKVTPEKVAINYLSSKQEDNSGARRSGEPIDLEEEDALFSRIPVEDLVEELNRSGVPSSMSLSAGSYICNQAMFIMLREAKRRGFSAGFIHLPAHSEWVSRKGRQLPSLPLETLCRAGEVSLSFLTKPKEPVRTPGKS
jgi:pyroglutamyl-peptidase